MKISNHPRDQYLFCDSCFVLGLNDLKCLFCFHFVRHYLYNQTLIYNFIWNKINWMRLKHGGKTARSHRNLIIVSRCLKTNRDKFWWNRRDRDFSSNRQTLQFEASFLLEKEELEVIFHKYQWSRYSRWYTGIQFTPYSQTSSSSKMKMINVWEGIEEWKFSFWSVRHEFFLNLVVNHWNNLSNSHIHAHNLNAFKAKINPSFV